MIHYKNTKWKKGGMTINNKVNFTAKNISGDKDYFIMTKGSIQQENIILNIYVTNNNFKIH